MTRRELRIEWILRDSGDAPPAAPVRGPSDIAAYLAPWASEAQEVAVVVLLDARMRVIGYREVGRGSVSSCPIDVTSVLRAALMGGASAIIIAHNHPSGDPTPSAEDLALTGALTRACTLIGIPLMDHLVLALGSAPWSIREHGWPE